MTYRSREEYLDSNCHFLPPTCKDSLFASPSEICHWNSAVWDTTSLSPPTSPAESLEDVSSQSSESGLFSCDSMSAYSVDHSTYYKSSLSPETKMEPMPETDLYTTTGWTDAMFMSGPTPLSPVMSETNQSAFTLPTSEVSFSSLGPSVSQEIPMMDTFLSNTWPAEVASNNFFAEPAVTESEMFSFPNQCSDVAQHAYQPWYTPSDAPAETYFAMETQGPSFAPVVPQTAGFVGTPVQAGYNNTTYHPRHARVDSLYSQASPQDVAVSLNSNQQDIAGPRRMTVSVPSREPIQAVPARRSEPDVPYGAPIQQYRTYAPGYPSGSVLPISGYGHTEVPVLGSNASVSSVSSSVAPSRIEESPRSPASSIATTARTKTEEGDGRARTDPLYSAKARSDGNYHCPFVTSEACGHKPTKLKCNYDKYIDSHIKPFRCKHQNCNNNRFSSTACLLRHEREAHGLHGHGNKPFLCEFKDCDRSAHDNGFPRAYNLLDHMKRVHGYRPEKTAKSPSSQSGRTSGKSQDKVKKAKPVQKSNSVKKDLVSPKLAQKPAVDQRRQQMPVQWQARLNELQQKLRRVQHPSDLQQVSEEMAQLQQHASRFG